MFRSLKSSGVKNANIEVGTKIRVIPACLHLLTVKDKFSDDLHIYPITEKRILLNLHVLKFYPSILDF